ncbi:hypothetical protein E4U33_001480 [Claviceps sp. LM78 group G4]|nr:hypothetical protein E4U33_001480 [Claviceps sp. LM78 group G4]
MAMNHKEELPRLWALGLSVRAVVVKPLLNPSDEHIRSPASTIVRESDFQI